MLFEDENTEFKVKFTDEIYKEVIAFANTDGGVIYIGVGDDGTIIRIEVGEGSYKPYYLKSKGLKYTGVYMCQGVSSAPASSDDKRF